MGLFRSKPPTHIDRMVWAEIGYDSRPCGAKSPQHPIGKDGKEWYPIWRFECALTAKHEGPHQSEPRFLPRVGWAVWSWWREPIQQEPTPRAGEGPDASG